jgi:ribosomal RNA-processing protein 9
VKLFDLSVMGYVETLFGHQDFVTSIDSLRGETAVTCGGRDRTVRYWKIVDETQLVFRGGVRSKLRDLLEGGAFEGMHVGEGDKSKEREQKTYVEGSMEVVCMIDETTFLSGGDSGYAYSPTLFTYTPTNYHRSISLWLTQKKKPVYVQALAHGLHETVSEERGTITSPRWITAIGSLHYSDLFASGRVAALIDSS